MKEKYQEDTLEQLRKIFGIVDEGRIVSDSDYEITAEMDDWEEVQG